MHPQQSRALTDSLLKSPLLVGDLPEASQFDRSKLTFDEGDLDLNPKQKLGHLYEDVLYHGLQQSARFELIAKHLQIFSEDQITLGELDFVLYEPAKARYIHLELAVKFHLALQVAGAWRYPGPDPRDHWEHKLERMESHQFQLARSPAAKMLLRHKWNIREIKTEHLIYGVIFFPIATPSGPLPRAVAPDCRQGIWLYQKQWETCFGHVEHVCHVPKYLWPAEMDSELRDNLGWITAVESKRKADSRCALFTLPESTVPFLIVPDSWPSFVP